MATFTTEQIVSAVNAAGFETLAEFGAFLAIGRKQIEIAKLDVAAQKVEDARRAANEADNATLQAIQAQKQAIADELKQFGG